jgi:hypothetical protein
MGISRRAFIACFTLFFIPTKPRSELRLNGKAVDPVVTALLELFADRESASFVGERYLKARPEERSIRWLSEHLTSGLLHSRGSLGHPNDLRGSLTRWQQADFATGRVVYVDGWVLSVTEARLCALAALML